MAHYKGVQSFNDLSMINVPSNQNSAESVVLRAALDSKTINKITIHTKKYYQTRPLRSCNQGLFFWGKLMLSKIYIQIHFSLTTVLAGLGNIYPS